MKNTLALFILALGLASVLQAHSIGYRKGYEDERSHGEYYEKRDAQYGYGVYPADTYPLLASSPLMVLTPPVQFTYTQQAYFPFMAHPPSVQNSFFPQTHSTGYRVAPTQAGSAPDNSAQVVEAVVEDEPKVEEAGMRDILGLRDASDGIDYDYDI